MTRSIPLRTVALAASFVAAGALLGVYAFAGHMAMAYEGPAPAATFTALPRDSAALDTAVLAGGCFWGVQAVFDHLDGVTSATAGYSGGPASAATYEQVSTGTTGHAESVRIIFDPSRVSYGTLLQVFFSVATDPTELNRQGPDVGTQYRSVIFYTSDAQKRVAESYIAQLTRAHTFPRPIVTQVVPLHGFYEAEAYHQHYAMLHQHQPYIAIYDLPKLAALRKDFPARYRALPGD